MAILGGALVGGALVKLSCPSALERDHTPDRFGDGSLGSSPQFGNRTALRRQIFKGKIDPPPLEIRGDVAEDVGQLERDTKIERVVIRPRIGAAENADANQTHRRRNTATVLAEIVERIVLVLDEIHLDAVDHVIKLLAREVEAANKGLFCQLVTIPLFKDHKVLTQVAGHASHTIKLLPPLIITDEDCDLIEHAFDDVIAATHRVPGAIWSLGKTLVGNAVQARQ